MTKFQGDSHARVRQLWLRMRDYYREFQPDSRLQNLKPTMIKGKNHPKLRAKAGETRSLIPCGRILVEEVLGEEPEEAAAKIAARHGLFANMW